MALIPCPTMFRKTAWRNVINDLVSWHQDQALNTTIFILKEYGPTGFLLKEERDSKNFKVCLGDPHNCTCPAYMKEKDLCKHICWVLMKKFKLPRDHEYCFQLGLVERQIAEVLHGSHRTITPQPTDMSTKTYGNDPALVDRSVRQKDIETEDVCPICQEEVLRKRLPLSYCRFGCGNNVHISCMKIWADHQTRPDTDTMVKCPLCREDFGSTQLLQEQVRNAPKLFTTAEKERLDKHLGISCNNCGVHPITGTCFKCTVCSYYHLCEACAGSRDRHPQHLLAFRMKRNQEWQSLAQPVSGESQGGDPESAEGPGSACAIKCDVVPERVLRSLLFVRVRRGSKLLDPGWQCRLCLRSFLLDQHVRHLPCRHTFHLDCVDKWLQQSNICPLDGRVIYDPLTWNRSGSRSADKPFSPLQAQSVQTDRLQQELFVPGTGLLAKPSSGGLIQSVASSIGSAAPQVPAPLETVVNGMQALHINCVPARNTGGSTERGSYKKPPAGEPTSVSDRKGYSSESSRGKLTKGKPRAQSVPLKQNVSGLGGGAEVHAGMERPKQDLFVGFNSLPQPEHSKKVFHPRGKNPGEESSSKSRQI